MFSKHSIGLDISDRSIEAVELVGRGKKASVRSLARVQLPVGVVTRGMVTDAKEFTDVINRVFSDAKPKAIKRKGVVVGIPEIQSYNKLVPFQESIVDQAGIAQYAREMADKHLPLPANDRALAFSLRHTVPHNTQKGDGKLLLSAAKQSYLTHMTEALKTADVTPAYFDNINLANMRAIFKEWPKEPVCILDIGARVSTLACFDADGLRYSYDVPIGRETIVKDLMQSAELSYEEANTQMFTRGVINPTDRTAISIVRALSPLLLELRETIEYTQTLIGKPVIQVVLVGGTSNLPGILDYIASNVTPTVTLGEVDGAFMSTLPTDVHATLERGGTDRLYIGAVGLAFRQFSPVFKDDPVLPVPK